MNRPLIVTDCDEVLLYMVRHFRDWLGEDHGVEFRLEGNPFVQSMKWSGSGEQIPEGDVWRLLQLFFKQEMDRQTPIDGAVEAIAELQREADVVVLTNLTDQFNEDRRRQLQAIGINVRVYTNQGPKGPALRKIVEEYAPSRAVFIDDLAQHHASVAEILPSSARLHLCGEPAIAPHVPCAHEAGDAHARIDNWAQALPWLQHRLHGEHK